MEYIKINQFSGVVPIERKFICRHCLTPVEVFEKKIKEQCSVLQFVKKTTGEKRARKKQKII